LRKFEQVYESIWDIKLLTQIFWRKIFIYGKYGELAGCIGYRPVEKRQIGGKYNE